MEFFMGSFSSRLSARKVVAAFIALLIVTWACAYFECNSILSKEVLDIPRLIARQIGSLFGLAMLPIHGLFLIAGGLLPLRILMNRRDLNARELLPVCLIFSALTGYCTFWLYVFDHRLGKLASALYLIICFRELYRWGIAFRQHKSWIKPALRLDVLNPLMLMILVAAAYYCALNMFQLNPPNYVYTAANRFMELPPDNDIPLIFANRLWWNMDPRPIFSDWLSSDRPPLLTGIVLNQRILNFLPGAHFDRHYQIIASLVQCWWVPAVWILCRRACLSLRNSRWVILACFLSGFFFLNSVFVWPKLQAAALLLFAFAFLLRPIMGKQRLSCARACAAAAAAMLGFLSHGGVAFSILALGGICIPMVLRNGRSIVAACVVAGVLYLPWLAYQKFYNPPGNRLLKWHLAGVRVPNDPRGVLQTVRDEYGKLTFESWLQGKRENLWELVRLPESATVRSWRASEFFGLIPALGVLNMGLLIYLLHFLRRRKMRAMAVLSHMFALAALGLLVWFLIMFEVGGTLNHQNSYATIIALFVIGAVLCNRLPDRMRSVILTCHALDFLIVWLATTPDWPLDQRLVRLNVPMVILTAVFLYVMARTCLAKKWIAQSIRLIPAL
jgi:hypothetical protein